MNRSSTLAIHGCRRQRPFRILNPTTWLELNPVASRTFVVILAVSTLLTSAVGDDSASRAEPAWVSFAETPVQSQEEPEWHARATKNTNPNLLRIISAFVNRATDLRLSLVSYSDADLRWRTDKFLVAKIEGKRVILTTGSQFPAAVTRSLAKRLRSMSYDVELVATHALLRRNETSKPSEPEFVVPFSNDADQ